MISIDPSDLDTVTGGFTYGDRTMYSLGKFHGVEAGLSKTGAQRNGMKWLQFGRLNGFGTLPPVPLLP